MSYSCGTELPIEAAGLKITMTSVPTTEKIILKFDEMKNEPFATHGKSCGFHLTKSKWDPYPWVGSVERESIADRAGLRPGDCLLDVDDTNVLGLKMKDVGALINGRENGRDVNLRVWRYESHLHKKEEDEEEIGVALKGPLPEVAAKLANALSGTIRCLECPVCLENATPPVSQCVHGHILCVDCRPKASRCPVCRVRLGQGRCLVAEKVHKVIRDTFRTSHDVTENGSSSSTTKNLMGRLFGGRHKTNAGGKANQRNGDILPKPRRLLLTKLFLGGLEKAASTENLTTVPRQTGDALSIHRSIQVDRDDFNVEKLSSYDRAKSASTGELSLERGNSRIIVNSCESDAGSLNTSRSMTLSVPHTPLWGGSTDSISNVHLTCPLSKRRNCGEVLTSDTLLEHLSISHEGPQVHFYAGKVQIPFPLPFGSDAVYVLHYAGDRFFFQHENETLWMTSTLGKSNAWEWTLRGWGSDGTEIKLRRNVASLEYPLTLLPEHIAPLPRALSIDTIDVQLLEYQTADKSDV
ncbi:hypothetical protein KPH14_008958 [Odynerus spinipes]|uniref:RING-type domain-containing protein n=1 Tax=Odynerus spinipes TaxID=1348599 RepID=A0AAD9RNB8_9HYME|nr:hypothetical protein KPH14_008958 [Odynerus spinipes]